MLSFPYLGLPSESYFPPASAGAVPPLARPAAFHFPPLHASSPTAVVAAAADDAAAARMPACLRLAGCPAVAAVVGVAWKRKLDLDVKYLLSLLVGGMEWMAPILCPLRGMVLSVGRVGRD